MVLPGTSSTAEPTATSQHADAAVRAHAARVGLHENIPAAKLNDPAAAEQSTGSWARVCAAAKDTGSAHTAAYRRRVRQLPAGWHGGTVLRAAWSVRRYPFAL